MGIKSLGSFMQRRGVFREYCLCNTKLIIDGKNLCHILMENSYTGNKYGGNCDTFCYYVEHFFRLLKNCGVEPYVVMDGAYDPDDKKFDCLIERCEEKILEIAKGRMKCFPILAHRSFTYTVKRLGLQIVTCNYEADREIAVLAKSWKCPLLSSDNDFFIYDLPGGYIRYSDLKFKNSANIEQITHIDTWIYNTESVLLSLRIEPLMLPLLVVFLDNDYFTLNVAITKIFVSKILGIPLEEADRRLRKSIDVIVDTLSEVKSMSEGVEILSECVGEADFLQAADEKSKVMENVNTVLKHFDITVPAVTDQGVFLFKEEMTEEECTDQRFPSWLMKDIRSCEVSPFVLNVLDKRVLLKPNLEDLNQEYMYNITSSLRQVLYKLVTGRRLQEVIVEHHRVGCRMDQTRVFPMTSGLKLGKLPTLNDMENVKEKERTSILSKIFQFPSEALDKIPKYSKMFVLALIYLAKHSGLNQSVKGIKCLLFSHMLLLWREYGHIYGLPVDRECVSRVFEYSADGYRVPFDIELLHEFQRFQTVIDILYDLNGMLLFPVMRVNPCVMYKGGLMYTLFTKTDNEHHLDRIIGTCFNRDSELEIKFTEILKLIAQYI